MKRLRCIILPFVATLFPVLNASAAAVTVPRFPIGADGKIEIRGAGTSPLSEPEMVQKTIEWIYMNIPNGDIVEDGAVGAVTANGSFVVAREGLSGGGEQALEFMEYTVAVVCGENTYSYSIDNVHVYVATAVPAWQDDCSDMHYDISRLASIAIPDDYIRFIETAQGERQRLRRELEGLLAEDISTFKKGRLRRYEQNLDEAAEWYAVIDGYYRTVLENYMACYDFLTALGSSLDETLSCAASEAFLTDIP